MIPERCHVKIKLKGEPSDRVTTNSGASESISLVAGIFPVHKICAIAFESNCLEYSNKRTLENPETNVPISKWQSLGFSRRGNPIDDPCEEGDGKCFPTRCPKCVFEFEL